MAYIFLTKSQGDKLIDIAIDLEHPDNDIACKLILLIGENLNNGASYLESALNQREAMELVQKTWCYISPQNRRAYAAASRAIHHPSSLYDPLA
eukprot:CAMPEP_0117034822 /NCGR_PEP_ID=MMETSP0472-20121206/24766_1 /TAXON_ID=693140 ORGANISM="Tiarina fusus, Strain LIS" /NCGR_SAMPLE_ID=MMETSP0472 /ASSEMBLY_ACC=CAM_ASM_000603 /LENGTH=93 /DNA_ID=CAMNT_0004744103 /DNA_START=20 /DNA_END=301 /DNA_ORIENTATION=+